MRPQWPELSCWTADGGHDRGCQDKEYVEGNCWEALLPCSGSQSLVRNHLPKVPLLSLSWCQGITTLQALTCYLHSQQGFYVQSPCRWTESSDSSSRSSSMEDTNCFSTLPAPGAPQPSFTGNKPVSKSCHAESGFDSKKNGMRDAKINLNKLS